MKTPQKVVMLALFLLTLFGSPAHALEIDIDPVLVDDFTMTFEVLKVDSNGASLKARLGVRKGSNVTIVPGFTKTFDPRQPTCQWFSVTFTEKKGLQTSGYTSPSFVTREYQIPSPTTYWEQKMRLYESGTHVFWQQNNQWVYPAVSREDWWVEKVYFDQIANKEVYLRNLVINGVAIPNESLGEFIPPPGTCGVTTPTPTATSIPTNTPVVTSTAVPEPTDTPEATATLVPTDTPEPTATLEPTATVEPTATTEPTATSVPNTPTPTVTETPEPTATATLVPTDTPQATATAVATETPEATSTPEATATSIPTNTPAAPTATSVPTDVPTDTPEPTATLEPTATSEPTATLVPTDTPAATATSVPTNTPVAPTATSEPTATVVPTATLEPTSVPTATIIATNTPEPTSTSVPTETPEPTATATIVPTDTPQATATAVATEAPEATSTPEATATSEPTATIGIVPTPTTTPAREATSTPTGVATRTPLAQPTDTPASDGTPTAEPTATVQPTSTPAVAEDTPEPTEVPATTSTPEATRVATQTPAPVPTGTLEPTATSLPSNTPEPTATVTPNTQPTGTPAPPTATPALPSESCWDTMEQVGGGLANMFPERNGMYTVLSPAMAQLHAILEGDIVTLQSKNALQTNTATFDVVANLEQNQGSGSVDLASVDYANGVASVVSIPADTLAVFSGELSVRAFAPSKKFHPIVQYRGEEQNSLLTAYECLAITNITPTTAPPFNVLWDNFIIVGGGIADTHPRGEWNLENDIANAIAFNNQVVTAFGLGVDVKPGVVEITVEVKNNVAQGAGSFYLAGVDLQGGEIVSVLTVPLPNLPIGEWQRLTITLPNVSGIIHPIVQLAGGGNNDNNWIQLRNLTVTQTQTIVDTSPTPTPTQLQPTRTPVVPSPTPQQPSPTPQETATPTVTPTPPANGQMLPPWLSFNDPKEISYFEIAPDNEAPYAYVAWEPRMGMAMASTIMPTDEWLKVRQNIFFDPRVTPYAVTGVVTDMDQTFMFVPTAVFRVGTELVYVTPSNARPVALPNDQQGHFFTWDMQSIIPLIEEAHPELDIGNQLAGVSWIEWHIRSVESDSIPVMYWDYFGLLTAEEFAKEVWHGHRETVYPIWVEGIQPSQWHSNGYMYYLPPHEGTVINAGAFKTLVLQ